ncbi:MAG: hypothetical protein PHQ62_02320 [Clostridia bacterium]|nr:hypothetical protein [Clostridia bacterium]
MADIKLRDIIKLSKISPVLVVGLPATIFGEATVINADIPSKNLGIVNTANGLKYPSWFFEILKGTASHQIIINGIDKIDKESQEKFYELLKYKAISNVELPHDCNIIVIAENLKNVSATILNHCQVIK